MEGRIISRRIFGPLLSVALLLEAVAVPTLTSCTNEAPPVGSAVKNRDSMAVMVTYGVSKLISDSGLVRYKIVAEEWHVFDKTTPSRQEFPKGIFLERYDRDFRPNLHITADTAYCYNQNLWELRGRVFVENDANGTSFATEELYWDMGRHELYSNKFIHIVTPDRDLKGYRFRSNEQMTNYEVDGTSGYVPKPRDKGTVPDDTENTSTIEE